MPPDTIPLRAGPAPARSPADAAEVLCDRPEAGRALSPAAAVERQLLPAREAAALCAVSLATWHRWAAAGRAPAAVRIGATVRWRAAELINWIAAGCPPRREWEARRRGR